MTSGQESNIFTRTAAGGGRIRLQNWKPGALTGTLACQLVDVAGKTVDRFERPVTVDSSATVSSPLKAERFGLYTLERQTELCPTAPQRAEQMMLARLPRRQRFDGATETRLSLRAERPQRRPRSSLVPFRKAGIVWFREYAFSYDWLLRAKGDDGRYAGWPYYPKIVSAYLEAGAKCLPVIQKSITASATSSDGKVTGRIGPDRNWTREISGIITCLPRDHALGTEQRVRPAGRQLEGRGADRLGQLPRLSQAVRRHPVSAGRRGTRRGGERPGAASGRERLLRCIQSGDFDKIAVVNSHHYCGTDAPEVNLCNFNMGSEGKLPSLLFDDLRAVKRAAQADGKPRQSWLTEFGWDTLAGPVVSPYEQAVYLPRAWMMAMAAGTDKAFWFYNFDAAEPKQFFDGCGLLQANGEPKLVAVRDGRADQRPAQSGLRRRPRRRREHLRLCLRERRQARRRAVDDPRRRRPHACDSRRSSSRTIWATAIEGRRRTV